MAYLDPPFFTKHNHSSVTRDRSTKFAFGDLWGDLDEYVDFLDARINAILPLLKNTGSIFVQCDKNANFIIRTILNRIFGENQFRSEIIWTYKRWSNSKKGLTPSHQTIFFYSKTDDFKFNKIYCEYSETTNVEQLLQLRARDEHGVSVYATDDDGNVMYGGAKNGVPLSDVWEIPFLNPKAKERAGYPTQKPVLLLERIIAMCTDPGDVVLDPFCGSGTTLVAAKLLGRGHIGIDVSDEALELTRKRLEQPIKTESDLLKKGRAAYVNADQDALRHLSGIDAIPVQRNSCIDALLNSPEGNECTPIRVQRPTESINDAVAKLVHTPSSQNASRAIVIRTHQDASPLFEMPLPSKVQIVDSIAFQIDAANMEKTELIPSCNQRALCGHQIAETLQ
jgi:site-specific DNA-methyltransferase (adenine-specific)